MVGARSFTGNPYDGHTLSAQIEQSTNLMQDLGGGVGKGAGRLIRPKQAIVDLGFRGKEVNAANPGLEIIHRGRIKSLNKEQRRWLKRRQAIEPAIGHLKSDYRMQRCWLKGETRDALHALCRGLQHPLADAGGKLPEPEGLFAGLVNDGAAGRLRWSQADSGFNWQI